VIVLSPEGAPHITRISIVDARWYLNGTVTYKAAPAEGLLMNVRMVNAVFEDTARADLDPEANTAAFIRQIPGYIQHGIRAFTLNLQGGMPGYEGARNSAFDADGSLSASYLARVQRVIETCSKLGAVCILGCYYQRQDQVLRDAAAVRAGVANVAQWIRDSGYHNVLLEVANEFGHSGFDHAILRSAEGQVELIELARQAAPGLLVSTSGTGNGVVPRPVAEAGDFLLIHLNETPLEQVPARIHAMRQFGKPVVCNEDDKVGQEGAHAAELCVANGASWGLMEKQVNQYEPFTFNGHDDDPFVYAKMQELTTPARSSTMRSAQ
jgi:hypothetical protein